MVMMVSGGDVMYVLLWAVQCQYGSVDLPRSGQSVKAVVTHILSARHFYIHRLTHREVCTVDHSLRSPTHTHTQRSVLLITLILMHWLLYNWVYWRVFITFRNPYYRTIDIRQCRFSLVSTLLRPFNSCTSLVTKAWLYPHVQLDSFGAQENSGWICFLMPAQHMWVAVGRVLQSLMSWGWFWMSSESA